GLVASRPLTDPCFCRTIPAHTAIEVVMDLAEHPAVRRFHESQAGRPESGEPPRPLDAAWLRQLCLDCGADDPGLVEISRPALDDQRDGILRVFPPTRTLLIFVCRMNREPVRST